jgi:hypothetical protein
MVNVPWYSCSRKSESGFEGSNGGKVHSAQITPASEDVISRTRESPQVVAFVSASWTMTVLVVIFHEITEIAGPEYTYGSLSPLPSLIA